MKLVEIEDEARERDEPMHRDRAGLMALRVDAWCLGDSEGALVNQYTPRELQFSRRWDESTERKLVQATNAL